MEAIECPKFDEEKYVLGTLCRRGHEWGNSGKSLRYLRNDYVSDCKACAHERAAKAKKEKPRTLSASLVDKRKRITSSILVANHETISAVMAVLYSQQHKTEFERLKLQIENLKTGRYHLSSVCQRQHNWLGLGFSVRNMDRSECQCCSRENKMRGYYANHEHNKERCRIWRERNRHTLNVIRSQKYHSDADFRLRQKERSHAHFLRNRDRFLQQLRQYNLLHPGAKKARNCRRRAKVRNAKLDSQFYGNFQLLKRFVEQGERCSYCQKHLNYDSSNCTIDHVQAISKDGKDEMKNILMACGRCNRSKNNTEVSLWYKRQPFYSEERLIEVLHLLEQG